MHYLTSHWYVKEDLYMSDQNVDLLGF